MNKTLLPVTVRRYLADPELVKLVLSATSANGETDTAKWMTGGRKRKGQSLLIQ